MRRRKFLKASIAGSTLAFPGRFLLAARSINAAPPDALHKLFDDESKIRRLGNVYRLAHPAEDDIAVLQDLAVPVTDMSRAANAIQSDFERGDIVQLDGWILSRTEARHCALYSLQTTGFK